MSNGGATRRVMVPSPPECQRATDADDALSTRTTVPASCHEKLRAIPRLVSASARETQNRFLSEPNPADCGKGRFASTGPCFLARRALVAAGKQQDRPTSLTHGPPVSSASGTTRWEYWTLPSGLRSTAEASTQIMWSDCSTEGASACSPGGSGGFEPKQDRQAC